MFIKKWALEINIKSKKKKKKNLHSYKTVA